MKIDKNFIGIVILLVAVGSISGMLYFRQPEDTGGARILNFPIEIGEWKGTDIPLDERTYAILETRNVVMREYNDPTGKKVYLYIVASEINRRVSHPPEVCYTGDGVEILESQKLEFLVPGLKEPLLVNRFLSRKDGNEALVFYWYKAGDKFTSHYLSQQAKVMVNKVIGKTATASLIRISTPLDNGDKEKASQTLQEFSRKIIPLI